MKAALLPHISFVSVAVHINNSGNMSMHIPYICSPATLDDRPPVVRDIRWCLYSAITVTVTNLPLGRDGAREDPSGSEAVWYGIRR